MSNIRSAEPEGVIPLVNEKNELVGVIKKDMVSRKNVIYKCEEMSFDELQEVFKK